jgi:ABC-type nickel/cobalt efflux system permease component RcnA
LVLIGEIYPAGLGSVGDFRPGVEYNEQPQRRAMFGFDELIASLGGSGVMTLVVAALLGLRHATDPDHLTAVSTLFLANERYGPRQATALGLSWGLGHALTLFAFGLPVVLFRQHLPGSLQRAAEAAIGVVIVALAIRLLTRWRRGCFHLHAHSHGSIQHAHPHAHEHSRGAIHAMEHTHPHAERLGRSPVAAFGIGMIHGVGGSAGVGVLLVGAMSGRAEGALALLVFAAGTAASLALVSTVLGYALAYGGFQRRLGELLPVLGALSLLFGVWYSLVALQGST